MALNIDVRNVKNPEEIWGEDAGPEYATSVRIGFACMAVGIGEITEKTIPEFWGRYFIFNQLEYGGAPMPFTIEDLKRRIGLRTNVFPKESRAKWIKRIVGSDIDREAAEAERRLND